MENSDITIAEKGQYPHPGPEAPTNKPVESDNPQITKDTNAPKLVKKYLKQKCVCGKDAYFLPQYNKLVCFECMKLPAIESDMESMAPIDFLPEKTIEGIKKTENAGSRFKVVYPSPDFYAVKDLPDRNDPCVCGSGKKFKKCCLDTIKEERNKAVLSTIESKKNNLIVTVANTVKLLNTVKKWFDQHPDDKSVETSMVTCQMFEDHTGKKIPIREDNVIIDEEAVV